MHESSGTNLCVKSCLPYRYDMLDFFVELNCPSGCCSVSDCCDVSELERFSFLALLGSAGLCWAVLGSIGLCEALLAYIMLTLDARDVWDGKLEAFF